MRNRQTEEREGVALSPVHAELARLKAERDAMLQDMLQIASEELYLGEILEIAKKWRMCDASDNG